MSAKYGWLITDDLFADAGAPVATNSNAVGVVGPRDIDPAIESRLRAGEGEEFRMLDDDAELIYRGRIIRPTDNDNYLFTPLDDFGMPNFGCTEIWYKGADGTTWEQL